MPSYKINYTQCVVIVHGKSELNMVQYIKSNLHLPIKMYSKDNGRSSIQINGLTKLLNSGKFKSVSEFVDEYTVEYDKKTKSLKNFKLFIIMDTDDCDDITKDKYISSQLFDSYWLKPYIVPIYNIRNIEDVMIKAKIMVKRISEAEKGTFYSKIFPINTKPLSYDTVNEVNTFKNSLQQVKETNLCEFIDFRLCRIEEF